MSDDLAALVAAGDWPRALERAVAAWRDTRATEAADLVEAIGARVDRPRRTPPLAHAAWMERADRYDPVAVGGLLEIAGYDLEERVTWQDLEERHGERYAAGIAALAAFTELAHPFLRRSWSLALFDRVLAIAAWPDDPRVAAALLRWLVAPPVLGLSAGREPLYRLVSWRLQQLGDARAIPRLRRLASEPTAPHDHARGVQAAVADETATALRVPPRDGAAAALFARVTAAAPARRADLDALWREVAARPDDDAPRAVLADALMELGDARGELIALQLAASKGPASPDRAAPPKGGAEGLSTPRSAARIHKLTKLHWYDWLDDAALAITRRGTRFVRGMIDEVRVGMYETPPWAYAKAARHRELACVRVVRTHQCTPEAFAELVDALPREPERIAIGGDEFAGCLATRRRATRQLEYARATASHGGWANLGHTFARLAEACPAADELWLVRDHYDIATAELDQLLPLLPRMFPRLQRVHVHFGLTLSARAAALPYVVRES